MKHEIFDPVVNVLDSNVTFEQIYKKAYNIYLWLSD